MGGNCNKGLSEKLQRLQNRAACIRMSASYDSNLDDLFRALGWRRLYYQRLEQKSILMYKTLHGMTPDYLRSRFVYRDNARAYRLRNTENKLVLPQPRTDYLKRSFFAQRSSVVEQLTCRPKTSVFTDRFQI